MITILSFFFTAGCELLDKLAMLNFGWELSLWGVGDDKNEVPSIWSTVILSFDLLFLKKFH
jgi:hypothetical protein